jgi:uncharacterized protein (TIGR03435 family)
MQLPATVSGRVMARALVAIVSAGLATSARVVTQSSPVAPARFEVSSIKRSDPAEADSGFAIRPGGRFVARNVTVRALIAAAYHVERTRVTGGPTWVDIERFTVEALAFENVTRELLEPMLRNLLAERFNLRQHTEKRELPVLLLKPATERLSALRPSSLDCSPAGVRARAQAAVRPALGRSVPSRIRPLAFRGEE